jgi:hypothetical protein
MRILILLYWRIIQIQVLKLKIFFETKKILSHIRFDENITNDAVNIFIKDYSEVLNKYDYITFSDCDLIIDNSDQTFREIKKNLEFNDIVVSCVDLNMSNLPKVTGSENWIPNPINITDDYIECDTGIHLMTIKRKDFWIIENVNFLDSTLISNVKKNKKKWVKTLINKAYHLTWDLYYDGNEYFEYKKNNNIWNNKKNSNYKILKNNI